MSDSNLKHMLDACDGDCLVELARAMGERLSPRDIKDVLERLR